MPKTEVGEASGVDGFVRSARFPSDDERLDAWLLVRLRHSLNCAKQCAHARLLTPRGL
jgi:hypothetical protein